MTTPNITRITDHFTDIERLITAEKDSARLDWLVVNMFSVPRKVYFGCAHGGIQIRSIDGALIGCGTTLRNAIDDAKGDKAAAAYADFLRQHSECSESPEVDAGIRNNT